VDFKDKMYILYPNPCNNIIHIKASGSFNEKISLKVFDLNGRLMMYNHNEKTADFKLDLTNYQRGIYLFQIIGKDFIEMPKALKL
jgi:hypothetical protein